MRSFNRFSVAICFAFLLGQVLRADTTTLTLQGLDDAVSEDGSSVARVDVIGVTLNPESGTVHGKPGETLGWGFHLTWASNVGDYLVVSGSSVSGAINGSAAGYKDVIGGYGGNSAGAVAPGETWSAPYEANTSEGGNNARGLGYLTLLPTATPGTESTGQIQINFDVYAGIPNSDEGDYLGSFTISIDVTVAVDPLAPSMIGSQVITFDPIEDRVLGDAPFELGVRSSSNLPVTVVSGDPSVCTVEGKIVTIVGAGACLLHAIQDGDSQFPPSTIVSQLFKVTKQAATVNLVGREEMYDGSEKELIPQTEPEGLPTNVFYNGDAAPPKEPGEYLVQAIIDHPDYVGSAEAMLTVTPLPQPPTPGPTGISLELNPLAENGSSAVNVGALSAINANPEAIHSFVLFNGVGGEDNALFEIVDRSLIFGGVADFEAKGSYSILVQVRDNGDPAGTHLQALRIPVSNVNEVPSFSAGPGQSLPGGTNSAQTVAGWAGNIQDGDSTVTQTTFFTVSVTTGADLFTAPPSIAPNGTLTYTPTGRKGTATVAVTITDDTSIGGNPALTSAPQTLTIAIGEPLPDRRPPVLVITAPAGRTVPGTFNIAGTVRDDSTLASLTAKFNGTPIPLDSPVDFRPNTSLAWSVTGVRAENGPNLIEIEATDFAGRRARATKSVTFTNRRPELAGTYQAWIQPDERIPSIDTTGLIVVTVAETGSFSGSVRIGGVALPVRGVLGNNGAARLSAPSGLASIFRLLHSTRVVSNSKKGAVVVSPSLSRDFGSLSFEIHSKEGLAGRIVDPKGRISEASGFIETADDADVVTLGEEPKGGVMARFNGAVAPYSRSKPVPPRLLNVASRGQLVRGYYTMVLTTGLQRSIPRLSPPLSLFPNGDGYGELTLASAGTVTLAGYLADGTKYSTSGLLRADGTVALFVSLFQGKGCLGGDLEFSDESASDVAANSLLWIRPPGSASSGYPEGWPKGISVAAAGAKYAAPLSFNFGQGPVDPNQGNAKLTFDAVGISSEFELGVNIDPATGVAGLVPAGRPGYTFSLRPATGLFAGQFLQPNGAISRYRGILVNKGENRGGFGYFLMTNGGGGVSLQPRLTQGIP
jgi:hypothetical protein